MKKQIEDLIELEKLLSQKCPNIKLFNTLSNSEFNLVISCKNFAELIRVLKESMY